MSRAVTTNTPPITSALFKVVATTAIVEEGHVLMVKQGSSLNRGRWNLPGGKLDPGETIADAAVRETWEETGLKVKLTGIVGMYAYANRSGRSCMRFVFRADVTGGDLEYDGDEILDARWFGLDQLRKRSARLCKPTLIKTILSDVVRDKPFPMKMLRQFDPTRAM